MKPIHRFDIDRCIVYTLHCTGKEFCMAIVCHECGCINENDNARFCNDCGARLTPPVAQSTGSLENPSKLVLKPVEATAQSVPQQTVRPEPQAQPQVQSQPVPVQPVQPVESIPLERNNMPAETMVYMGQPTQPIQPMQPVQQPIYDDDDDDYVPNNNVQSASQPTMYIDDVFDDDDDPVEAPVTEKPSKRKEPEKRFGRKEPVDTDVMKDGDDGDPYYDDVLPEIDNEIRAIPKDIIFKVIGVIVLAIVIAFYMLSKLS